MDCASGGLEASNTSLLPVRTLHPNCLPKAALPPCPHVCARVLISPPAPRSAAVRITVTSAVVSKWCETAKGQASLGTMRYLVKAYRMACHYGDSEEEVRPCVCVACEKSVGSCVGGVS